MTVNFIFESQVSFNKSVYFNNLFRTIAPAVKRSNLSLKTRPTEGVTELRKSLIC